MRECDFPSSPPLERDDTARAAPVPVRFDLLALVNRSLHRAATHIIGGMGNVKVRCNRLHWMDGKGHRLRLSRHSFRLPTSIFLPATLKISLPMRPIWEAHADGGAMGILSPIRVQVYIPLKFAYASETGYNERLNLELRAIRAPFKGCPTVTRCDPQAPLSSNSSAKSRSWQSISEAMQPKEVAGRGRKNSSSSPMRTKRPDLKLRAVWLACGSERLSPRGSKSAVREARAGVLRVDGSRLGDKIRFSGANQDARDRLEEKGTRQAKSPGSVRAFYLHLLEERYLSIRTVELELDEKRRTYDWDLQELTTQRERSNRVKIELQLFNCKLCCLPVAHKLTDSEVSGQLEKENSKISAKWNRYHFGLSTLIQEPNDVTRNKLQSTAMDQVIQTPTRISRVATTGDVTTWLMTTMEGIAEDCLMSFLSILKKNLPQDAAWGLQQTRHERTLEDIQGRYTAVVAQKDALQEKHRETLAAFTSKNHALVRTVETKQAEFTTLEQRYQALSKHTSASTTQSKSLFKEALSASNAKVVAKQQELDRLANDSNIRINGLEEKLCVVEDQLSAAECSGMQLARQAEIDLAQIRDLELHLDDAVDSERRLRDRMDEKLEAADSALKQVHGPLSEDLEQWGSDISRIAAIRSLSSVSSSLGLTNPMQMSSIKDSGIKSDKLRLPAPSSTVTTPMSCSALGQLGKTERLKLGLRYANPSATDKDGEKACVRDTQILAVLPKLVEYDLVEPKGWQRLREWRWSRRRSVGGPSKTKRDIEVKARHLRLVETMARLSLAMVKFPKMLARAHKMPALRSVARIRYSMKNSQPNERIMQSLNAH
ncbi:hypothetical protein C8R47DRAFT_1246855 [Mycena vitilis]|nr:hypothetical protein C8R47DRAFT_1246855 [Mycena vitilis]